ncbi:hypothetical protein HKX48_008138 [Thoreauomyces humboldtii]|nr:hypothetical protein HKX48_008138 [Thoreauomyces humboldtii]
MAETPSHDQAVFHLPAEVFSQILLKLDVQSICRLGRSCKRLLRHSTDDVLWKQLCARDFRFPTRQTTRSVGWRILYARLRKPAVFTWGASGNRSTLGRVLTGPGHCIPGRILELDNVCIVQIVVCGWGMVALATTGDVYWWGRISDYSKLAQRPTLMIPMKCRVQQIAGGRDFCMMLTPDGHIWSTTTGLEARQAYIQKLAPDERVTQISAGWTHGLALTSKGRVLQWHDRESHRFLHVNSPDDGEDETWIGIAGGENFSIGLSLKGNVYTWEPEHADRTRARVDEVSGKGYTHVSAAFRQYALFSPPVLDARSVSTAPPVMIYSTSNKTFKAVSLPSSETASSSSSAPASAVVPGNRRDRIIQTCFGDWHTAILTEQGHVYTSGGGGGASWDMVTSRGWMKRRG